VTEDNLKSLDNNTQFMINNFGSRDKVPPAQTENKPTIPANTVDTNLNTTKKPIQTQTYTNTYK